MNLTLRPQVYNYQLIEFLGEGLNSRVYSAIKTDPDAQLEQKVALKILKSETLIEVWRQEFQALMSVRSSHCIRTYGWERLQGQPALVLEYCEGVSLTELISLFELKPHEINELLSQISLGLKDLNAAGFTHGDLSLSNILIDTLGHVKLIDFGLNRHACTQVTPAFAAPEVLEGSPASFKSDLYSLGKIGFALLTQSQFSTNEQRKALMQSLLQHNPDERCLPNLPEPNKSTQNELGQMVLLCLQKRRRSMEKTRQVNQSQKPASKWNWLPAACIFLILAAFSMQGDAFTGSLPREVFKLSIRTQNWAQVFVNDRPYGYAPVDLILDKNKKIELKLKTARGQFSRTLTKVRQRHIVIDDSQFKK